MPAMRNAFLTAAALFAASASAFPISPYEPASFADVAARDASTNATVSSSLQSCLTKTGVELSYPSANNYSTLDVQQNAALPSRKPGVFALPADEADVAAVVKCVSAENGNQKISPRSGGHSYTGYDLGSEDGWVVVDLKRLNDISVNKGAKTAVVGAGSKLGPMASTLAKQGFALPHGTCPTVGTGGHGLGGGYGLTSYQWGYLMDHIASMRLVKADGSIVTVSSSENPDLWWALRGAGSNNFGIVTQFTYNLLDAPTHIVNYEHKFATNDDCTKAFLAMQDLTTAASAEAGWSKNIGGELTITGDVGNGFSCYLSGQFLGTKDEYKQAMKRYNDACTARGVTASSVSATDFTSWADALTNIMGTLDTTTVAPEPYYAKSLLTPSDIRYDATSFSAVMSAIQDAKDYGTSLTYAFFGPNSATNAVSPNASAYVHRDSLYLSQLYSYNFPTNNSNGGQDATYAAFDKIIEAAQAVKPSAKWAGYVNYVDNQLLVKTFDWGHFYYGSAVDRLQGIKSQVDPKMIFDFPMGIAHA